MTRTLAILLICALVPTGAAADGRVLALPPPPHSQDGPFRFTGPYRDLGLAPPVVDVPQVQTHFRRFGPYPGALPLAHGPYAPGPALPLPEGMMLDIDPPQASDVTPTRVDRWREVGAFLRGCWAPPPAPAGQSAEPREVTLRLGFNRAGGILGLPRVTYSHPPANTDAQKAFTSAARAALARCSPLPFTGGLGSAIAGVPFTLHFTDQRSAAKDRKQL